MKVKIGIVEDEQVVAEDISIMLLDSGYEVLEPAMRYDEAIEMIEKDRPDLLLLDINIPGKRDGVDLAETVKREYGIPFIFLTANSDSETLARVIRIKPAAFLTKPVMSNQLHAAIEIAINSAREMNEERFFFVNNGRGHNKVFFSDILYAISEENYVRICLIDGKELMARMTFSDLISQLDGDKFVRTHRCYVVSIKNITAVHSDEIMIGNKSIPIGRTYKATLLQSLRL